MPYIILCLYPIKLYFKNIEKKAIEYIFNKIYKFI